VPDRIDTRRPSALGTSPWPLQQVHLKWRSCRPPRILTIQQVRPLPHSGTGKLEGYPLSPRPTPAANRGKRVRPAKIELMPGLRVWEFCPIIPGEPRDTPRGHSESQRPRRDRQNRRRDRQGTRRPFGVQTKSETVKKRLSVSVYPSARLKKKAEDLIHPVTIRGGTIKLQQLRGLQVPVNVVVRVRHREGLHTHSSCPGDTLRDLNSELGVDGVMVFFGTVDDDVLVFHLQ